MKEYIVASASTVNGVLLTLFLTSAAGLSNEALGAPQISEAAACKMAMVEFSSWVKQVSTESYGPGPSCSGANSIKQTGGCKAFISDSQKGWAKISIPFTRRICDSAPDSREYTFTFQRFDQGWKIIGTDRTK